MLWHIFYVQGNWPRALMYKTYISTKLIFQMWTCLPIFHESDNFNVIFNKYLYKKAVLLSVQSYNVLIVYSSKVISYR